MRYISDFVEEGVIQSISSHRNVDRLMNSGKMDYHNQRLARIEGRVRLLRQRLKMCQDVKCKKVTIAQIAKWKAKYNQQLMVKPDSMTMKTY